MFTIMGGSVIGGIIFFLILLYVIEMIFRDLAALGVFGINLQTFIMFGKIDAQRERLILKCLAHTAMGNYTARLFGNSNQYIVFLHTDKLINTWGNISLDDMAYSFYVHNWNQVEFGYESARSYYYSLRTTDDNTGTISYETRKALLILKHELLGERIEIDENRSILKRLFVKDEVVKLS